MVLADAAVSHQAAAVREAGLSPRDVVDFTPELKAEAMKIAPSTNRPLVHAADHQRVRLQDRDLDGAKRRELARRFLRSRHRTSTSTRTRCSGALARERSEAIGYELHHGGGGGEAGGVPDHRPGMPLVKPPWGRSPPSIEQGSDRLAGGARRDSRLRAQSPGAQGAHHSRTGRTGGAGGSSGGIGTLVTKSLVISGERHVHHGIGQRGASCAPMTRPPARRWRGLQPAHRPAGR